MWVWAGQGKGRALAQGGLASGRGDWGWVWSVDGKGIWCQVQAGVPGISRNLECAGMHGGMGLSLPCL